MIGPVGDIAMTDGAEWAGPVSGTIDYRTVILIWGSSVHKKDTTLVDGGASISPEELGRAFLDYILRGGWIDHVDIAGQCDNTISVRNGACVM